MGRRKKYFTDDEIKEASIRKAKNFYEENKDHLISKSKEKYWIKRIKFLKEEGNAVKINKAIEKANKAGVIIDFDEL